MPLSVIRCIILCFDFSLTSTSHKDPIVESIQIDGNITLEFWLSFMVENLDKGDICGMSECTEVKQDYI